MSRENEVCVSKGNIKMGEIKSISLPPISTCRACQCHAKCYAAKIAKLRKTVRESYERNLRILNEQPEVFYKTLDLTLATSRLFRLHVSGDFCSKEYMARVFEIVEKNPLCEVLVFTKRYEWVNEWLEEHIRLPDNLHLIFSGWKGLPMSNPFLLPECHVIYKDGSTTAADNKESYICSGNCSECHVEDKGCWSLKKNQQVLIKEH